ncbi:RNA recognition motif domain [Artemisia annua]|uniref:RNA recognition motif domain n=1 Tax=Artemisia annua TaxID=35608 RepID=A0A2U1MRD4_ARTAN|nr:RNA recognition motif domain [Artemisia annua]
MDYFKSRVKKDWSDTDNEDEDDDGADANGDMEVDNDDDDFKKSHQVHRESDDLTENSNETDIATFRGYKYKEYSSYYSVLLWTSRVVYSRDKIRALIETRSGEMEKSMPKTLKSLSSLEHQGMFPVSFLKRFSTIKKARGLVIADEDQCGFARTGSNFWEFQNHDIVPNIVTMAKVCLISNGSKIEEGKKTFMVAWINAAFSSRKRRDSITEKWVPKEGVQIALAGSASNAYGIRGIVELALNYMPNIYSTIKKARGLVIADEVELALKIGLISFSKVKKVYGFIDYFDRRSAALAIMSLNGRHIFGQPVKVNWAYASGRGRRQQVGLIACFGYSYFRIGALICVFLSIIGMHGLHGIRGCNCHFHSLGAGLIEEVRVYTALLVYFKTRSYRMNAHSIWWTC